MCPAASTGAQMGSAGGAGSVQAAGQVSLSTVVVLQ